MKTTNVMESVTHDASPRDRVKFVTDDGTAFVVQATPLGLEIRKTTGPGPLFGSISILPHVSNVVRIR